MEGGSRVYLEYDLADGKLFGEVNKKCEEKEL